MMEPRESIRQTLIDRGIELALSHEGLASVTVQAVIAAAGLTRESFARYFPDEQSLVEAIFSTLMEAIDREIDDAIANDSEPFGSFTRAYIMCMLDMDWEGRSSPQGPLSALILTETRLRTIWSEWHRQRDMRHRTTDGDLRLSILRSSAQGIWLAEAGGMSVPEKISMRKRLLQYARTVPRTATTETSLTGFRSTP